MINLPRTLRSIRAFTRNTVANSLTVLFRCNPSLWQAVHDRVQELHRRQIERAEKARGAYLDHIREFESEYEAMDHARPVKGRMN